MSAYKYISFLVAFLTVSDIDAQEFYHKLPETSYKDFGFKKPVKQSVAIYYQSDSAGHKAKSLEFHTFNEHQKISQRTLKIFGQHPSQTDYNYVYKDGLLDSLNVTASTVAFSSYTNYIYNDKKQIIKSICNGKYTNYTNEYAYDGFGMLTKVTSKHKSGNVTVSNLVYNDKKLVYLSKLEQAQTSTPTKTLFYFLNDKIIGNQCGWQ